MNAVAVEKAGIASGVLSMFRMVGGSLGVAVTGAIFQGSVGTTNFAEASPQQFVDALGEAMSICAAFAVLGAVIGAVAIRSKRDTLSDEAAEAAVNFGGEELAGREVATAGNPAG
jgi:hypothetical protein